MPLAKKPQKNKLSFSKKRPIFQEKIGKSHSAKKTYMLYGALSARKTLLFC